MDKKILLLMILLCIIPISATIQTLGTYKQNSCVILKQTCGNCTYTYISSVTTKSSNGSTIEVLGVASMTKVGYEYTYTFCNTTNIGEYIVNGYSDVDGYVTVWAYNFFITKMGLDPAGDFTTIFIYILFCFVSVGLIFITIYNITKLATLETTPYDVAASWGFLILLLIVDYMSKNFLITTFIDEITNIYTNIGVYILGFLPILSLVLVIIIRSMQKKKPAFVGRDIKEW